MKTNKIACCFVFVILLVACTSSVDMSMTQKSVIVLGELQKKEKGSLSFFKGMNGVN